MQAWIFGAPKMNYGATKGTKNAKEGFSLICLTIQAWLLQQIFAGLRPS